MTLLHVEVEDFVAAAVFTTDRVAEPVRVALGRLTAELADCAAMAGNDPGGTQWATAYDDAARQVLAATAQVVNGAYRTSSMFGRSAMNYAQAEAASTSGGAPASSTALVQRLPGDAVVGPSVAPSAAGGDSDTPAWWWLIQHTVGYVWPNGRQDRLRRAATAWRASADVLSDVAATVPFAAAEFMLDDLPEGPDISTVCAGLRERLLRLCDGHRALATACSDLAGHIDHCHSEVESELAELGVESAVIQTVGGLLSIATFGAAEVPTQGVQVARVAAIATRVGQLIDVFVTAVRTVCRAIPSIAHMAEDVRVGLRGLTEARLAYAGTTRVPALARVGGVMHMTGKGVRLTKAARNEIAATERLSAEAGLVPRAPQFGRASDFTPPRVFRDKHGRLTNGRYTIGSERMAPHTTGSLASGKSQFFGTVDADKSVLDAAAFAEKHGLFNGAKAKVYVENGPVGVSGRTGEPTHWINVYRTKSGFVHGCPGR